MNKGVCENPDCPYSHDEKFLIMTREWQDYQNGLEHKKVTFDGEGEAGRGAFVVIRAAMPASSSTIRSSLRTRGQRGSVRKPQKIRFTSPNRKDICSYPWRDKSSVEFIIIGKGREVKLSSAPVAAVARSRRYSWQPPPAGRERESDY